MNQRHVRKKASRQKKIFGGWLKTEDQTKWAPIWPEAGHDGRHLVVELSPKRAAEKRGKGAEVETSHIEEESLLSQEMRSLPVSNPKSFNAKINAISSDPPKIAKENASAHAELTALEMKRKAKVAASPRISARLENVSGPELTGPSLESWMCHPFNSLVPITKKGFLLPCPLHWPCLVHNQIEKFLGAVGGKRGSQIQKSFTSAQG